ncbi:hypothetical protein ACFV0L_41580 [Streptosporangium canum]|uniref:hypothetical protein n=1 Tax=Streptosporangium canum TaxID=324952 RepID=UPI0036C11C68
MPYFFESYRGEVPDRPRRHEAMLARCRDLLAFTTGWSDEGVQLWHDRIATTTGWTAA